MLAIVGSRTLTYEVFSCRQTHGVCGKMSYDMSLTWMPVMCYRTWIGRVAECPFVGSQCETSVPQGAPIEADGRPRGGMHVISIRQVRSG